MKARKRDRQAEFGAFLCLTVPKTAVESPETGQTGRVSGKKLPVGRKREGGKEEGREGERKEERGREGESEKEREREGEAVL